MNFGIYLIPANTKSGKLIFSLFTKFDLILLVSGVVVSILSLLLFTPSNFQGLVTCLVPGLICVALVVPVPNYHNIFTVLKELINFFYNRRNYKWEGWCSRDEFK